MMSFSFPPAFPPSNIKNLHPPRGISGRLSWILCMARGSGVRMTGFVTGQPHYHPPGRGGPARKLAPELETARPRREPLHPREIGGRRREGGLEAAVRAAREAVGVLLQGVALILEPVRRAAGEVQREERAERSEPP